MMHGHLDYGGLISKSAFRMVAIAENSYGRCVAQAVCRNRPIPAVRTGNGEFPLRRYPLLSVVILLFQWRLTGEGAERHDGEL